MDLTASLFQFSPSPGTEWTLAEGCTDYGFETWVLLDNPWDAETNATLPFMQQDGSRVPYERRKIIEGLQKACYKRPVSDEQIRKKKRGFLMGEASKALKGRANGKVLAQLLDERLG